MIRDIRSMDTEKENKLDELLQLVSKRLWNVPHPKFIECSICHYDFPGSISSLTGGRCLECALEIDFGVIPSLAPTSVGGGTPFYYRSDDEDPMLDNCTRIREGD